LRRQVDVHIFQFFLEVKGVSLNSIAALSFSSRQGLVIYPTSGFPAKFAELVKIYLLPASGGNGTGKKLKTRTFISAIESGYEHLYLESFPELDEAINMWPFLFSV